MPTGTDTPKPAYLPLLQAGLLLLLCAQVLAAARFRAATFDEAGHLVAGYTYATTGSLAFHQEALPLGALLGYAPLALAGRDLALPHDVLLSGGLLASELFWQQDPAPLQAIRLGRLGPLAAALLLAAVLARFASDVFGWRGGLLVLVLTVTDPNLLAHGGIITRDLLLTLWAVASAWLLWRGTTRGTIRWPLLLAAALALGLAGATRFTAVLLVLPLLALLWLRLRNWRVGLGGTAMLGVVAALALWGVYRFTIGPVAALDGLVLPAPDYFEAGLGFLARVGRGTPVFFFGQVYPQASWYQALVILLVKTPLLTLAVVGVGTALAAWRERTIVLVALLYLALAIGLAAMLAYRHLLPGVALLLVMAGGAVRLLRHSAVRRAAPLLLLLPMVQAAWVFPDHLSYFNLLVGGSANGYRVAVDSNLDWGQDLPALASWMQRNDAESVRLAYFGATDPALYGVQHQALPGFKRTLFGPDVDAYNPHAPEPGIYVISATSLQLGLVDSYRDLYDHFRDMPPLARIGDTLLVFNKTPPADGVLPRWVVTGERVANLPPDLFEAGNGVGVTKWTATTDTLVWVADHDVRYINAGLDVLNPTQYDVFIAHTMSHSDGVADVTGLPDLPTEGLCRHATAPDGTALAMPQPTATGLALLGYTVHPEQAQVTSYWLVRGQVASSLVQFVHWRDIDGTIIAQADGWGAASAGLEPDDVIVHRVQLNSDAQPASIALGLYSPQTSQRYTIGPDDLVLLDHDCP